MVLVISIFLSALEQLIFDVYEMLLYISAFFLQSNDLNDGDLLLRYSYIISVNLSTFTNIQTIMY